MKVPRLRPWLAIGLVAVAGAVGALTSPAAHAATGCRVDYSVTNQWPGGFGANVSIDNLGDPVDGWKLTWSFSAGQTITQLWNGTYTQSGSQVTVTNASYNGAIPSGGSTSFGFNGAFNGSNPAPSSFALNGVTCTGGVTGSPSPSPSASPSANASPSPSASPSTTPVASRPCDIYASGGTPCVAAHSTTRALFRSYSGNLYQVRRSSDNATRNIGVLTAGGIANAAAQDSFCAGTTCVITVVYDQSGHGNDVAYQGPGGAGGRDTPATATSESLTVGGGKAYSLYIKPGNSYWRDGHLTGVPTGSAPEGMYMITSGTHVNSGCCFDYGNSETTRKADGAGAMDAIYFGTSCWFGGCSGSGPWVQADLEYGLYPGGSQSWNPNQRAFTSKFVTAMLKNNGTSRFAIKGGNAQSGAMTTLWDGALPRGYSPMRKQGAIILGSGGDCCATNTNLSQGTFYEGAIVSGYPSDATENAVQADVTSAGYR
ncbi:Cellulose binding domain-containing protein [Microbispora rosea]|uniref:Cellulose binding domain-containing protein n=1 Tax=Microbispora rosea TaxID=58117 RepID=A0A1N7GKZ3_9ACTN|nr:arabinofuranosidase catalytic domain-containing protein [Microbispora rosea]GIH49742.1 alpha-L-arabinofuranosidase [Microbispora rosea subsp. rosea]SIS13263.1 Cellulose binding domain-containing protein [Microbispora rosea]